MIAPALGVLKETLESFATGPAPENDLAWAKLRRARGVLSAGAADVVDRGDETAVRAAMKEGWK